MKEWKKIETYRLLREHGERGLEILYQRYGKKLYGYGIASWKLNEDESWDMVYKTLYKVVEKINDYEFENEKKFSSFLFTVFCNFLRRHYRDTKRIEENLSFTNFSESLLDESRFDGSLAAERKVAKQISNESVRNYHSEDQEENPMMVLLEEALSELEDWQRILLLQRSLDRPYSEIAEFVGKPVEQLKVYYQRVKTKLENILATKMSAYSQKQSS